MEEDFYKERLVTKYGLEVLIPHEIDRQIVHDTIYHELCLGTINPTSRTQFVRIIHALVESGAGAIILGCTEITLLINQKDVEDIPLFDTTQIHAESAVEYALR